MPSKGHVAAGHRLVAEAGAAMLAAGGNAFDAIVACGFAASIAEPGFTSLGGGGFCQARTADGDATLFDFFVDTPGRGRPDDGTEPRMDEAVVSYSEYDQSFLIGPGSCAVPGVLAGLCHVHGRLGRMPLAEVVAPTVTMARDGLVLDAFQAYTLRLLGPINGSTERGRALLAPGGEPLAEGATLRWPEHADFLERLAAEGDRCFYEGETARRLADEQREQGGRITARDLAGYAVVERAPLSVPYRGRTLLTNPAPSFGGPLVAESLRLLEESEVGALGRGSPEHLLRLVEVQQAVDALRGRVASKGTTHMNATDAAGAAAAMSLSNGEGSGVVVAGTGVMLNNMLGEDDLNPPGLPPRPPGERVPSMMAPSILLQDGRPRLVFGTGGSKRIRMAIVQVLSGVVDFGLDVRDAVEEPRVYWDGERVQLEPGYADGARAALAGRWDVAEWSGRDLFFGGVHAIDPDAGGWGDSRRDGAALGV